MIAVAAWAAVAGAVVPPPAGAADSTDVTGDITAPQVASFTVTPGAADVTSADARFDVRLQITDDLSGVDQIMLSRSSLDGTWAYGIGLTLASGDARDGIWTGSFAIPKGSPAGPYPFHLSVADRVRNGQSLDDAELARRGLASHVDITDSAPDASAPTFFSVAITPDPLDARGGPATVTVTAQVRDSGSGVDGAGVFLKPPNFQSGGAAANLTLASGTAADGTWTGTATLPEHTRAGRWTIEIRAHDRLNNERSMHADALRSAGLTSSFDVLSNEDATPPTITSATVDPVEVNVHDADRTIRVRVRAGDDLTGISQPWSDDNHHYVGVVAYHPVLGQSQGVGLLPRVSGTALDGWYEGSFSIPKSSATGPWLVQVGAMDAIGNSRVLSGAALTAAGASPTILVYNVPLPPLPIGVRPGDGLVTVQWDPPTDVRGADVTEYIVRSTSGAEVRVPGDARSAVVSGLPNGTAQQFRILAVNKAGPSDPSSALTATPQANPPAAAPSAAPSPPAPASSPPLTPASPGGRGYRMVTRDGQVAAFGSSTSLGDAAVGLGEAVDIEATPTDAGYWIVDRSGHVFAFGDARWLGGAPPLAAGEGVTSLSRTPSGNGYWLFTTAGRVLAFGDAPWLGDMTGTRLNGPVLDSVPSPSGRGYYLVASDGGVFTFGDADFRGSMGGVHLNAPVQSLVPDPDGRGYWLVASDGGIFSFDAPFHGSAGDLRLNRPITGMVGSPTGGGYLMVAEDGGIFNFGDVAFHGSLGASPPSTPVVAVAAG